MKEEDKFQQIVYVNYRLEKFIYLLNVTISVSDNIDENQPMCKVLWKQLKQFTGIEIPCSSSQNEL